MNCSEFNEKISFYIDNELPESEKNQFELHLSSCKKCSEEFEDMINFIKSLNEIEDEPIPNNYDEILRIKLEKEKKRVYNKSLYRRYLPIAAGLMITITSAYFINSIINVDNKQDLKLSKKIESSYKKEKTEVEKVQQSELALSDENKNDTLVKKENISKEVKNSKEIPKIINSDNVIKNENNIEEKSNESLIASSPDINENLDYNIESSNKNIRSFSKVENYAMSDNNTNEKNVNIGEIISIEIPEEEGNKGTWHYNMDNDGIVEVISEDIQFVENKKIHIWKIKALKEGKINIKYELYEEGVPDKIYDSKEHTINVDKQNE